MDFKTVAWASGANIYEVNVRQYTSEGTFAAFAKHLPRLKDMGVQIIWLMPITPISKKARLGSLGSYYACSSYTQINPEFGSFDDFKNIVDTVHQLDMKIIIDWVANHTGQDHEWTETHPDYYVRDDAGNFTERNGWKDVIDLNYANNNMRAALIDAMKFWINNYNIDGFRCDMAHLVPLDFWQDARMQCDALKPLYWLAECEVVEYHPAYDASYGWEWMHVSEKFMQQFASLQHFKDVLNKYLKYPEGAQKLLFTANHDENSWNGTEYEKYGNAAHLMSVLTCTWPAIPLIYSGQELPNYKRLKFFDKDEIEWSDKQPALHQFYKILLNLRIKNRALHATGGFIYITNSAEEKVLSYLRIFEERQVLVLLNLSGNDKTKFTISAPLINGVYTNAFSGLQFHIKPDETFELQAWEYLIFEK